MLFTRFLRTPDVRFEDGTVSELNLRVPAHLARALIQDAKSMLKRMAESSDPLGDLDEAQTGLDGLYNVEAQLADLSKECKWASDNLLGTVVTGMKHTDLL